MMREDCTYIRMRQVDTRRMYPNLVLCLQKAASLAAPDRTEDDVVILVALEKVYFPQNNPLEVAWV